MSDILRIVSYSYALQSSSSIFLLFSCFTGWSGCRSISNLFFQYYQFKIAGTPLNSFWCLILEFMFLNSVLCFPGQRVSEPRSAGDGALTWWHLDCPSGHYKESWSIFLKCFSIWERDVQGRVEHSACFLEVIWANNGIWVFHKKGTEKCFRFFFF